MVGQDAVAARALSIDEKSVRTFLGSKWLKLRLGEGFQCGRKVKIVNQTYSLIPTEVFSLLCQYWAEKKKPEATALLAALSTEAIEKALDQAEGVQKTQAEY